MLRQRAIVVTDSSQIGEARRAATTLAIRTNFNETDSGRIAIVVMELATNLVRYGQKGVIFIRGEIHTDGTARVEVLAIDSGPGMDFSRCSVDGYSTGGTPGNGLGAIQRLADEFDVYSTRPSGTVIMAAVCSSGKSPSAPKTLRWGVVSLPARGEQVCGDAFGYRQAGPKAVLMVADGLGHGPDAAKASACAVTLFDRDPFMDAADFIRSSHAAMAGTRGAALAVASLDGAARVLHFAGVGNIAGTVFSAESRRGLPSNNGIVGAVLPRLQPFEYPLPDTGLIVLHSDGLQTRWSLDPYPGLALRHPAVVAGVLYRDFGRGRDDVTVLVTSWQGGLS